MRPLLYSDTLGGKPVGRDDLWAVSTGELNEYADHVAAIRQSREYLETEVAFKDQELRAKASRIEQLEAETRRYQDWARRADAERDEARLQVAHRADPERILAWVREQLRRAAADAFTAGPERQVAYAVEMAESKMLLRMADQKRVESWGVGHSDTPAGPGKP